MSGNKFKVRVGEVLERRQIPRLMTFLLYPFSDSVPDAARRGDPMEEGGTWKGRAFKVGEGSSISPKTSGLPRDSEEPLKMLKGNSVWAAGNRGHVTLPYDPNLEAVFFNREMRYCLHFFLMTQKVN